MNALTAYVLFGLPAIALAIGGVAVWTHRPARTAGASATPSVADPWSAPTVPRPLGEAAPRASEMPRAGSV